MSPSNSTQAKSLGVLGGTFDPIHNAHIACALAVQEHFNLQTIKLIPCATTPHRDQPIRSADQRCEMVRLAINEHPKLELDERECAREGNSFTIDTMKSLRSDLGNECALIFILGTDAFKNIETWHQYEKLLTYCHLVVVQRPDFLFSEMESGNTDLLNNFIKQNLSDVKEIIKNTPNGHIYFLEGPLIDMSATKIRESFNFSQSTNISENIKTISLSLAPAVKNYIHQNGLYQER